MCPQFTPHQHQPFENFRNTFPLFQSFNRTPFTTLASRSNKIKSKKVATTNHLPTINSYDTIDLAQV